MPLFKVWNVWRTVKKFIIANSFEEFKEKCREKLEFSCASQRLKIVVEKDGTEVDDYEVLLLLQSEILIALQEFESWCDTATAQCMLEPSGPVISSVQSFEPSVIKKPTEPSPSPSNQIACLPSGKLSQEYFSSQSSSYLSAHQISTVSSNLSECSTTFETVDEPIVDISEISEIDPGLTPLEIITRYSPLPKFSSHVLMHLSKGDSSTVWGKLVDEAALYYSKIYPSIHERSAYKAIGQAMIRAYPAIKHEGPKPWTVFASSLSSKIRRYRWVQKRRNQGINNNSLEKPDSVRSVPYPVLLSVGTSCASYETNVLKLQKACMESQQDRCHIQMILKETFGGRRRWIDSAPCLRIQDVLQKYPCFDKGKMVLFELNLLLGSDTTRRISMNMENLKVLVKEKTVFSTEKLGPYEDLEVLDFLFQETAYRGKGTSSESFVELHENVQDQELVTRMASKSQGPLKLIVFLNHGSMSCGMITGEGVIIDTEANTIFDAVLVLISIYYCYSLQYPRIYSQLLGLLQEYWLEQKFQGIKSRQSLCFINKLFPEEIVGEPEIDLTGLC